LSLVQNVPQGCH